jgi:hypothetical protein
MISDMMTGFCLAARREREEAPAAERRFRCGHCGGEDLRIGWGRRGYHFACQVCDGETPIAMSCGACGGRLRIRESGLHFFAVCDRCPGQPYCRFFTNP